MADLWVTVGFLAFFGLVTGLLSVTFLAFTRMDRDVRRARMFIMEKRIERFLGAFTAAFIALTVLICVPLVTSAFGMGVPSALSTGLIVLWLGGMGYGTYELFLIVRPSKGTLLRLRRKVNAGRSALLEKAAAVNRSGSDRDAAK